MLKVTFFGTTTLLFDDGKDQILFDAHSVSLHEHRDLKNGQGLAKTGISVDFVRKLHYNLFANMESSH